MMTTKPIMHIQSEAYYDVYSDEKLMPINISYVGT